MKNVSRKIKVDQNGKIPIRNYPNEKGIIVFAPNEPRLETKTLNLTHFDSVLNGVQNKMKINLSSSLINVKVVNNQLLSKIMFTQLTKYDNMLTVSDQTLYIKYDGEFSKSLGE